ncbi:MAG TPA: carboxypeptidase regulatory-like domain-containing protein [Vicinamibacterales bacterium]|nr:carboxypeptidase regulatory-like domain-containing protein [Vicinamibacterales bacterium]
MFRRLTGLSVAVLLLLCAAVQAQESASAGIAGQVLDSTRAALPGASVTVVNAGTNAQRVATTDAEGRFTVPNLPPAAYVIRVELSGFNTVEVKDFILRNGDIAKPTLTLSLASVAENITVVGVSPLLQVSNASVGQTITQKQIEDLPVAGRSLLSFAALSAGVTPQAFNRGTQFGAAGSSRSQYVTVEGGRDSSTNYAIDGVYVRSLRFNNLSLNPPLDAVQEVNVLRNSFTTEYGQGQAVVSIVTKSGTNRFATSAYDYRRDDALNAENYFGQKPGNKTQAGVTAGGPIVRNRAFIFGGYEGLRTQADRTLLGSVPNPAWLAGDFSSVSTPIRDPLTGLAFPGNQIPTGRFSNFAKVLGPTVPAPNQSGANNLRIIKPFSDDADTMDVRLDQVATAKHNLFERFMYYKGQQTNPSLFSYTDFPQTGRNLAVGDTWVISPAVVNETRVGYNYAYHLNAPISLDGRNWVGDIGLQNLAGATDPIDFGRPGFNFAGFTGNGEGGITQGATENIVSVSNATSWVKGRHNIRFGVQAQYRRFEHLTEVPPRGTFTFNGQFTGNPIADFLVGYCSTCTGAFGSSRSTYTSPTVAPFFDDNWQVNGKLTLQMGIRWEYLGPWSETNGIEGSFDAASGKIGYHTLPANLPAQLQPLVIPQNDFYPAGILQKDLNNWGPRVGVAYDLNERTVLRSGFGIYYDNLNLNELQFSRLVPPYYGQYSLQPTATQLQFPVDSLFPDLSNIPQFPAPFSMDPSNRTAYTAQWNANVQRSLGRDYVVEVAYTGSHSYNEHKRYNINQARPGTTPIVTRVPYPAFQSAILYSSDAGWARFNGLSFRVEKRYSAGLFFLGNYQVSKSVDNGSGEIEANDTAYAWDLNADEGPARYDQRHRAAISGGYELPFGPGKRWLSSGGPGSYALGGWQVQGIIRLASGFPLSVTSTNVCQCGSFLPQRVNFAPGRESDAGNVSNPTPDHWFDQTAYVVPAVGTQGTAGRNTVRGPGTQRVDASLSKRFAVNKSRLEFRFEVFNLLNHANFGNPDLNISNGTVATITTADDGRTTQFGLRFVW